MNSLFFLRDIVPRFLGIQCVAERLHVKFTFYRFEVINCLENPPFWESKLYMAFNTEVVKSRVLLFYSEFGANKVLSNWAVTFVRNNWKVKFQLSYLTMLSVAEW